MIALFVYLAAAAMYFFLTEDAAAVGEDGVEVPMHRSFSAHLLTSLAWPKVLGELVWCRLAHDHKGGPHGYE
jgi:hypothetical protein